MKHGMAWISMMFLILLVAACGVGKKSAVEGKLVDGNGKPLSGVKITASQVQPIKGYEQFEAVTKSDGTFRMTGLFPSSRYVLKPWSDKWTCETAVQLDSAPQGETAVLPETMKIRFNVSSYGVITDSQTNLEWLVGPDRYTTYWQAEQWAAGCKVAGGGWRMPTRQELKGLYKKGIGERNMYPVFKITGWNVWAEPRDSSSAWVFNFYDGGELWAGRGQPANPRVFGVRSASVKMMTSLFNFENLYRAWLDCRLRKHGKSTALVFEANAEEKLLELASELTGRNYQPRPSFCFISRNDKYREVFAACFRDRVFPVEALILMKPSAGRPQNTSDVSSLLEQTLIM